MLDGDWSSDVCSSDLQADHALTFAGLRAGGDMLSQLITNETGRYILSFDYLGTSNSTNCGGFIGYEPGDVWLGGTGSGYADLLPDTGSWERVTLSFSGPTSIRLQLEDYSGSGGRAGDAFFDNILVTDLNGPDQIIDPVPEPASLWLLASGVIGFLRLKRKKP
jgi:hypothetical protein